MSDKPMTEEREQCELVSWFKREYGEELAEHLHHSPNGGLRNKATARRFKYLGVRRGFPDLVLYLAVGKYVGLAIELKPTEPRRKPSQFQIDWLDRLSVLGFDAHVANGLEEGKTIIRKYMGGV